MPRTAEGEGAVAAVLNGARVGGARVLERAGYLVDCATSMLVTESRSPHGVAVYFHGVTVPPEDGSVDPQERVTPGFLRAFIRAMKARGYQFTTPDALLTGSVPAGNVALLTSDDGYASVERLLPVLEEEAAPLTLFVCAAYAKTGAVYWWDQLYMAGRSSSPARSLLKHGVRSRSERDAALDRLGLNPSARASRPGHRVLTPDDIGRLGRHPSVRFGNHSGNHLSLPLLADDELVEEVEGAGRDLQAWSAVAAPHFAFPYGDYDDRTLEVLARAGYRTAFTTEPGHFPLPVPLGPHGMRVIPRYQLRGDRSPHWQARLMSRGCTAGATLRVRAVRWLKPRLDLGGVGRG